MKKSIVRVLLAIMIIVMAMSASAFAEGETDDRIAYDGDEITFIKADGSGFGMWAPQPGTNIIRKYGKVYISIVPKNTTIYSGMHWGKTTDTDLTIDEALTDGRLTMIVDEDMCGYAHPIVAVKPDGTGTTTTQYYIAIPALELIPEGLEDGEYVLPELKAGPSAMFNHFVDDSKILTVDGDSATISFITDGSTASIQKYSKIALGKSSELVETNYQADLPEGTTIIEGQLQPDDGSEVAKYLFNITLPTVEVETLLNDEIAEDIYIIIWNKEGSNTDKIPGWYQASNDIYLSLGNSRLKKEAPVDLEITNSTSMFKVTTAAITKVGEDERLVIALNSSGYHELFKGTYEDAVANEDNTEKWIHGVVNADGKWEFAIPLEKGESYIPIISISNDYYQKYLDGQNSLERAFYPRQLVIDRENKKLVTGDYDNTFEIDVENNIKMFKPGTVADLQVIGGPNSNGYSAFITLHMETDSMDKVKSFKYDYRNRNLTEGEEVVIDADAENTFVKIPVLPAILDGGSVILKFHSESKDQWYNRKLTINLAEKKAVFDPLTDDEEAAEEIKDAKREAQKAVNEAEALDTSVYTPENAQAIEDALQALNALVASDTATVEEISTAKETLENAITKAKTDKEAADLQAAKDAAQTAVTQAEAVDTSVYSSENAKAIKDAIAALKDILANDTATADEITAAKKALEDAITKANKDKKKADEEAKKKAEEAKKKAIAKEKAKVKATKITGLKVKAGKKKMTVTWKKNTKVFGGYQIQYKVGKKAKTIKIKKASIAKKVIKKLKSKKKYTVKVRGFKKVGGVLVYGKWSAAKKAKIK